ncbi:MAG: MoaD/ThiS family protein [Microcystis sp.]|jgi:molybdopterin synthase sulfur carrier subunit|uniref:MoaD/ThiS family protein n=1 Tax=Microcystis sp. TaxID=1127 RepID=UPI0022CC42B4|nr:MoaD/ThiS family protein [Microcystis sp. LE17-20D]MCZ8067280.1 MoaD/ThiS family protein [Microcystis sp. LE17-20D]MCZ8162773.1 MoaD/ThiS family protein [Microcystis sp. LE19-196.1B]MCZ8272341.1 MoaD/ThiS family protein [Microcystis sp. LE19-4.1E]
MEKITVTVKLFAIYQEVYQTSQLNLEFPAHTSVAAVLNYIIASYPQLERWRDVTRFGVNLQFVSGEKILENGDEIVLIPPVSGG